MDTPLKHLIFIGIIILQGACSQPKIALTTRDIPQTEKDKVSNIARQQLGTEYKYGGKSPAEGFDCSGLVYYSFRQMGIHLPRTTFGQFKHSRPVSRKNLKQGDLLFFRIYRSRVSHVGIYLGNNRFIHSPSTGKQVSIVRLDSPYWQKRYVRAGRI